jgi:Bardet-Biedl syndrome 2 protein
MGAQTLMVGSEDFVIRKFYGEDMVGEITETDVVTNLCPVDDANHHNLFGFSLASGHIGVYNDDTRIWNAKSKHKCTSLTSFDLDEDGVPEILSGWHSGKFEVRNVENGSLVYKDNLTNQVAKVLVGDYR